MSQGFTTSIVQPAALPPEAQPTTFRASRWRVVGGAAVLACALAIPPGYWLLVTADIERSGGQQIQLMMLTPAVAGFMGYLLLTAFRLIGAGVRRYTLSPSDLTIRSLFGQRQIAWTGIRDFELPPAQFPSPPQVLVLIPHTGRRVDLPLSLKPAESLRSCLQSWCKPLGDHPLDQVHYADPGPPPSAWRCRWRRHRQSVFQRYGGLCLFILGLSGSFVAGYNLVNYCRIHANHATAEAEIVRMGKGDKTASVVVQYSPEGSRERIRIARSTSLDFCDTHQVGEKVLVDYLPHQPSVGRIREHDLDLRQSILLLFALPMMGMGWAGLKAATACWVRPLRITWKWTVEKSDEGIAIQPNRTHLEVIRALLPSRHATGTIIFKDILRSPGPMDLKAWMKAFANAGISCQQFANELILAGPGEKEKLLGRLGRAHTVKATYFIAEQDLVKEAAESIIENSAAMADGLKPLKGVRLCCVKGRVGPLDANEAAAAFDRYAALHIQQLYDCAAPLELFDESFAGLFRIGPEAASHKLLAERRASEICIWASAVGGKDAQCATYQSGTWNVRRNLPLPSVLRPRRRILQRTLMIPLTIMSVVFLGISFVLLIVPGAWLRGRKLRKTAEAIRGRLSNERVDSAAAKSPPN